MDEPNKRQEALDFSSMLEGFFSFRNFYESVLRGWKWCVILALLGAVVCGVYRKWGISRTYEAKALLFAVKVSDASESLASQRAFAQELAISNMLVNDYPKLLTSARVLDAAQDKMKKLRPDSVSKYSVSVESSMKTRMLTIVARAKSPEIARDAANVTADVFVDTLKTVLLLDNVQIVDYAKAPIKPVNWGASRWILIGFFGGLSLGVLIALLIGFLDQTIKNPEQFESAFKETLLGVIPQDRQKGVNTSLWRLLTSPTKGELSEAFRLARANLPYLTVKSTPGQAKVCLFTSTISGEGKSNCTAGMAFLMAATGKKVLLIDADLRKPTVRKVFDLPYHPGIVSYLMGEATVEEIIQHSVEEPLLDVITCGPIPPNPSEILMNDQFKFLLEKFRTQYDYIFLDCTPALFLAEPLVLAPLADCIVFVLACSYAHIALIRRTVRQLRQVCKAPIGFLINRFDRNDISCKYGYYRYKSYDRYYHYTPYAINETEVKKK